MKCTVMPLTTRRGEKERNGETKFLLALSFAARRKAIQCHQRKQSGMLSDFLMVQFLYLHRVVHRSCIFQKIHAVSKKKKKYTKVR